MKILALFAVTLFLGSATPGSARAEEDAGIDAGQDDAAADAAEPEEPAEEAPVGLQPAVYDSNLGCAANGRGTSLPAIAAFAALFAVWLIARARMRGRQ